LTHGKSSGSREGFEEKKERKKAELRWRLHVSLTPDVKPYIHVKSEGLTVKRKKLK
jgi:hypothetical protein